MSTAVTSARPAVSTRFLVMAIAGIAVVAALVISLLAVTGGSATGSGGGNAPTLSDNSCRGALSGPC